jgi:hypothetical protein
MEAIRIVKTVFPDQRPKDFNEWSQWFWGLYKVEIDKKKNLSNWDRNIYNPKIK